MPVQLRLPLPCPIIPALCNYAGSHSVLMTVHGLLDLEPATGLQTGGVAAAATVELAVRQHMMRLGLGYKSTN